MQQMQGGEMFIDKRRGAQPVYMQLATILRQKIACGEFRPGDRIPPSSKLSQTYGLSLMTVRQAVTVLVEEGLIESIHGSGTYVKKIEVGATHFSLNAFSEVLADEGGLKVRILKTEMASADHSQKKRLRLGSDDPVILIKRLILYQQEPFAVQEVYMPFDPQAPVVEDMLDATGLAGFFINDIPSGYSKGRLQLLPASLGEEEIELLSCSQEDLLAFKIEYTYYTYGDVPGAYGWFLVPHRKMPLVSRIGVWDE